MKILGIPINALYILGPYATHTIMHSLSRVLIQVYAAMLKRTIPGASASPQGAAGVSTEIDSTKLSELEQELLVEHPINLKSGITGTLTRMIEGVVGYCDFEYFLSLRNYELQAKVLTHMSGQDVLRAILTLTARCVHGELCYPVLFRLHSSIIYLLILDLFHNL